MDLEKGYSCDEEMKDVVLRNYCNVMREKGCTITYAAATPSTTATTDLHISAVTSNGEKISWRAEYKERPTKRALEYDDEFFNMPKMKGLTEDVNAIPLWITTYSDRQYMYVWYLNDCDILPESEYMIPWKTVEKEKNYKIKQKRNHLSWFDAHRYTLTT